MTACEPIGAGWREIAEIDALVRALDNLRHWSATAAARYRYEDDLGRRLHATAARLRDEARDESLRAAYALFEIDAIHDAWLEGRRPHGAPARDRARGLELIRILASIGDAEAVARRHDSAEGDRDVHAAHAQHADESAEAARQAARALIEAAFPGVRWSMIERASL